jgi:predicted nucleic acid-binding protein
VEPRSRRTFLDTGVLLDAYRAQEPRRGAALSLLNDPGRLFLTSPFVHLEIVPKSIANQNVSETRFYELYFPVAQHRMVYKLATHIASWSRGGGTDGLGATDALHLAAASLLNADEFLTTERRGRSIYRSRIVNVQFVYAVVD